MKKILIVEDDKNICSELKILLEHSGYHAEILTDFENAKRNILENHADLILLDINIPYINGETLLKQIRQESNTPIIMVTSRNTEIDEVLSMSYGADDYITKPYNPTILLLRINAIFKRLDNNGSMGYYHDVEVILSKSILKKNETMVTLTKNEMIIFSYLLSRREMIVSRDELMTELWNNHEYINDNALTVNVSRLRSKLKEVGCEDAIKTMKGQGYILQ